ncbi:MAG: ferredoxin, partial [Proteobacteria bacterium]|nr:ferredoxin [Pseudomonadota bacterium]
MTQAVDPPLAPDFAAVCEAVAAQGLVVRGALRLAEGESNGVLAGRRSLVLVGLAGRAGWDGFAASPEAADGAPDPLDRWSRRCLTALAGELGAVALYPFGGPPYWPFQRWAQRAEPVSPSPLGLLIHPEFGLWHSYRGA